MDVSTNPTFSPEFTITNTVVLVIYALLLIGAIVWIAMNRQISAFAKGIWVLIVIVIPLLGMLAWAISAIAENTKNKTRKQVNSPT